MCVHVLKHYNYTCPHLKREINKVSAKCWPSLTLTQHWVLSSRLLGIGARALGQGWGRLQLMITITIMITCHFIYRLRL